ncbi:hypothetical protein [Caudoviricetes sp.]|nr:hypothetical protein [Caudoviricetes sp.]
MSPINLATSATVRMSDTGTLLLVVTVAPIIN